MDMSDLQMKDRMADGRIVLCGSNAYEKKYYFNPLFDSVPESVKEELHIICVLFTEEAGGVFLIVFEPDGSISMETEAAEEDISGIVINPGGLTHTSVALLDALRGAEIPAVEVHLSNIFTRESYRHESVTAPGCIGVIAGFREVGYRMALAGLVSYLNVEKDREN